MGRNSEGTGKVSGVPYVPPNDTIDNELLTLLLFVFIHEKKRERKPT